jgi:hypothetical protein
MFRCNATPTPSLLHVCLCVCVRAILMFDKDTCSVICGRSEYLYVWKCFYGLSFITHLNSYYCIHNPPHDIHPICAGYFSFQHVYAGGAVRSNSLLSLCCFETTCIHRKRMILKLKKKEKRKSLEWRGEK